jgi:hypothetical protein
MREPQMFDPMIKLLETKGYHVVSTKKGCEPGADITAERDGHRLVIEMKGDSAALDVDLGTGIFQLLRHMRPDSSDEYALGVSEAYTRYVRQVEYPLRNLGIKVFVVGENPCQLW